MDEHSLSTDRLYAESCTNIRATDDISFKLMGFVPLVSGATLLTFFLKEPVSPDKAALVVALALFAALVTLGLFRWELRNIQTCNWHRRRAEVLESDMVRRSGAPVQPKPPLRIGKTEAEKWVYSITILAWLSVPPLVCSIDNPRWLLAVYVSAAILILALTLLSAFMGVRVKHPAQQQVGKAA